MRVNNAGLFPFRLSSSCPGNVSICYHYLVEMGISLSERQLTWETLGVDNNCSYVLGGMQCTVG